MRTRYILNIGSSTVNLDSGHIRNWDQIKCAYSRKDFNGVVRSFSSKFEFVGEAYDLLQDLYIKEGVRANAVLTVLTITDNWEWEERFRAPLDFSTITWDGCVLTIAAVDNSLSSMISALKNTKFEFAVGEDIPAETLIYDRMTLQNSVTHSIMSNTDDSMYSDGSVAIGNAGKMTRLPVYVVGNAESFENSPVSYEDQSSDEGSYFLKIENPIADIEITVDITTEGRKTLSSIVNNAEIHLMQFDSANPNYNGNYADLGEVMKYSDLSPARTFLGCFDSLEALMLANPNPPQDVYAIVGSSNLLSDVNAVYITPITNADNVDWYPGKITPVSKRGEPTTVTCYTRRYISKFRIAGYPTGTMFALLYKADIEYRIGLGQNALNLAIKSEIRTAWSSRAKAVTIDAVSPVNVARALINRITGGSDVSVEISDIDSRIVNTFILAGESIRGIPSAKLYSSFKSFCDWMEAVFGYVHSIEDGQTLRRIRFMHRSELFDSTPGKTIGICRDFKYSVDSSLIYSDIEVGYEKRDYNSECGRDEWNFTSRYTTNVGNVNKPLSLLSPYRADCYGLEFLTQKRWRDTTDDESDDSVFFVNCDRKEELDEETGEGRHSLLIHRGISVEGVLSQTVFNAEYSPYRCILANAGYIAASCIPLELKFASTDGNADVVCDGFRCDSNITIEDRLFSCGQTTFSTGDVAVPVNPSRLISVKHGSLTYTGFISSLEVQYARTEAAKYKLIVKSIE